MVTRLDNVRPALNIIHIYGKIENRERGKPENVLQSWTKIQNELRAIEARQECVLLCGDWNRAVGSGQGGVLGNKQEVSYGGAANKGTYSHRRLPHAPQHQQG